MPEKVDNIVYQKAAAESMTPEMLNYLTAMAKGFAQYDNAKNEAVDIKTPPAGIEKSPFYMVHDKLSAIDKIELAANGGHAASMMRMGDLTRKDENGQMKADLQESKDWLTQAHKSLEGILNDRDQSKAHQRADANWDMSAVHYYNSTLPEGQRADLLPLDKKAGLLPEAIKTPEEADLYYTTLAARSGTNHRYGEWVERVNEGTEYKMDAARKTEIMGMANSQDLPTVRIYGPGKENLGEAHNYAPYVSTAGSRADLLEKIRDGKTNPADPVDDKFDDKMKDKLEKLEKVDPKTKMSDLDAANAAMDKSTSQNVARGATDYIAQQAAQSNDRAMG